MKNFVLLSRKNLLSTLVKLIYMFRKVPHTYVIIFSLIIISAIATWFVPGGEYLSEKDAFGNEIEGTVAYHQIENKPQTWQIFAAMFKGFEKQAGIVVFILMIGGAFWIMNDSKAIDAGIQKFLALMKKLDNYKIFRKLGTGNLVIVFVMIVFSIFGAVFGMSEETIAFIAIIVPLAISMGYDSITGVCMVYVAAHIGFAGAILNPFTIGIAQTLAGIPLFSGIEYRMFCWLVINVVGIILVLKHAQKVKLNPKKSPVYEEDAYWREHVKLNEIPEEKTYKVSWIVYFLILVALTLFSIKYFETNLVIGGGSGIKWFFIPAVTVLFAITGFLTLRKSTPIFILNLLGFTIIFLIIGVMGYGWYIKEIASLFFAMGIISGIAMNKSANEITKLFLDGARDIMSAALVVGLAGGIIVILEDGNIIHTILYSMADGMRNFGKIASVEMMYLIQTAINIVIPSGSAKAALTIPIMAPFGDLIGLTRQATVMAYQLGDGFTNMITPTSGVLIGALGMAKIPYIKWAKWLALFMAAMIVLGAILLIPTVTMDLTGF